MLFPFSEQFLHIFVNVISSWAISVYWKNSIDMSKNNIGDWASEAEEVYRISEEIYAKMTTSCFIPEYVLHPTDL